MIDGNFGNVSAGVLFQSRVSRKTVVKINEEIVNSTKFCGVHRLGKSKQISGRPRPVIARFTCREDRELEGSTKDSRYESYNHWRPSY